MAKYINTLGSQFNNLVNYFCSSFSSVFTSNIVFSQVFGFIATIVFALDFYFIFNELAGFLKQGGESNEEPSGQRGNNTITQYHTAM